MDVNVVVVVLHSENKACSRRDDNDLIQHAKKSKDRANIVVAKLFKGHFVGQLVVDGVSIQNRGAAQGHGWTPQKKK